MNRMTELWATVRIWIRQTWGDTKASTDSGLLGSLRFFGFLYGPIDRSLPVNEAFRKMLRYRVAPHVGWRHALGGVTYLLFLVLIVTGVLLALYYRPSAQEAYPSIQHIVSNVSFGWLIRDVHVWAANLIVIAMLAHMAQVLYDAAYKPPRETNWLVGLLLLFVVLAFGATGYLLPWDQWAYWTVTEVMTAVGRFPVLGGFAAAALMGDEIVSGATLSRFFSLHVVVLPWLSLALLLYHFTLVRRRGIAPPIDEGLEQDAPWRLSAKMSTKEIELLDQVGTPFFPNHILRTLIVSTFTLAVLVSLAALYPRPIAEAANAYVLPDGLVSTWVPVDVSLALIRFIGPWGFALFWVLGASLVLIPLFDRGPERRPSKRPAVMILGATFFVGYAVAWIVGQSMDSVPTSAGLREEVLEERALPAPPVQSMPRVGASGAEPVAPEPEADP
jgi:quinol-cytochrome oxidoreductase complex cytochrome b subunit